MGTDFEKIITDPNELDDIEFQNLDGDVEKEKPIDETDAIDLDNIDLGDSTVTETPKDVLAEEVASLDKEQKDKQVAAENISIDMPDEELPDLTENLPSIPEMGNELDDLDVGVLNDPVSNVPATVENTVETPPVSSVVDPEIPELDIEIPDDFGDKEPEKEPVYTLPANVKPVEEKPKAKRGRPKKETVEEGTLAIPTEQPSNPPSAEQIQSIQVPDCLTEEQKEEMKALLEKAASVINPIVTSEFTSVVASEVVTGTEVISSEGIQPFKLQPVSENTFVDKYFDPMFEIDKINPSRKYQTRAIERTKEQLEVFGNILLDQGQLEPIHLHKEGDEYFVVVGFGRYDALKLKEQKYIQAIIHTNMPDSEIIKLSNGTNEFRKELTEWDKIYSVGKFHCDHPEIPKDGEGNCLVKIYGYSRASIFVYIDLYKYFSTKKRFVDLFNINPLSQYIFKVVFDARSNITEDNEDEYVDFIKEHQDLSKKDFTAKLASFIADNRILEQTLKNETETTGPVMDNQPDSSSDTAEIDKMVDDLTSEKSGQKQKDILMIKRVSDLISESIKKMGDVEAVMAQLVEIENVKLYIDNSRLNAISKKLQKFSSLLLKIS